MLLANNFINKIDGGRGNDRFVIVGSNSTGTIIGGLGEDTVTLPGDSSDYEFLPLDPFTPLFEVTGSTNTNQNTFLLFAEVEFLNFVNADTGEVQQIDVRQDLFFS